MKKLILQLFLNKQHVVAEITRMQAINNFDSDEAARIHRAELERLHTEWDRYEHMINLFFEGIGFN